MIRNIVLSLVFISTVALSNDYFVQVNYNSSNAKATSYTNSANDNTQFPSLLLGKKYKNIKAYLSTDYIAWEDAKAVDVLINMDYFISSGSLEYYLGMGLGTMKYEADDIEDTEEKVVANVRLGINYNLNTRTYLNIGARYLYTNDITIKDNDVVYSSIEDLVGVEIGLGVNF